MIGFDTETYPIKPGLLAPPGVCVSFSTPHGNEVLLIDPGVNAFEEYLNTGFTLVAHNLAFDLAVICQHSPRLLPLVFKALEEGRLLDTKIRQELLDIADGRIQKNGKSLVFRGGSWKTADYKLSSLEKLHLGRDRSAQKEGPDVWRLRYNELAGVPTHLWPKDALQYALDDAEGARLVALKQGPVKNEVEQCQAAWALHLMSCHGIRTDEKAVRELKEKLLREKKEGFETLRLEGFYKRVKAQKTQEADEVVETEIKKTRKAKKKETPDFIDSKGIPRMYTGEIVVKVSRLKWSKDMRLIKNRVAEAYDKAGVVCPVTEKKEISTDKDTLLGSGENSLMLLAEVSGLDKILQTYIPVMEAGTKHPINAGFNTLVNSGRTSCREPNLQNLPTGRRVGGTRECFVPSPGTVFISVDYDTLELRALAEVCMLLFGKSQMAEVIKEGKDLHSHMASWITGLSYEQIEKGKKVKGSIEKKARDCAKVANFGFPGGLGAKTLIEYARVGYGVILTLHESEKLKRDWLATWPEMQTYFSWINRKLGDAGEMTVKQLVSGRVRGGVGYCDGCNTLFQGLAADGAKNALYNVAKACYVDTQNPLFGCRPVNFVHDEIIIEAPRQTAHEAAIELSRIMNASMSKYIKQVPITSSPAMMDRWYKDAAGKWESGKLVPWKPES